MSESDDIQAFDFLQSIEQRSYESAATTLHEEDLSQFWTGVGFRHSGIDYVVKLDEVAEIISIPRFTKVPGAKSWVKGLANIRGTLLPIMDLHGFLGHKGRHPLHTQRMLVVNHQDIQCGIVVDEVLGLNHYDHESWVEEVDVDDKTMQPYIKGGFYAGEKLWSVFSLNSLVETPSFRQVALV